MTLVFSILWRAIAFGIVWMAATESAAPGYGLAAIPITVAFSYVLTGAPARTGTGTRIGAADLVRVAAGVVTLAAWVLWRSVVGALDISRRALRLPRTDVDPQWRHLTVELETERGRVAFALIMNLMPGTLTARLNGAELDLHVVSPDIDVDGAVRALTARIGRIERALV